MRNIFRKTLPAAVVASLMLAPVAPTHATIPELDYATLIQELLGNMTSIMQQAERLGIMEGRGTALGITEGEENEAWQAGFANSTVRISQQATDVHNLALQQDMQPLQDACAQFSRSMDLGSAFCEEERVQESARSQRAELALKPEVLAGMTARLEAAMQPRSSVPGASAAASANSVAPFDFGAMLPGTSRGVLSQADEQLAIDTAILIAPGAIAKASGRSKAVETTPEALHRMAREVRLSMAHDSLMHVLAQKATDDRGNSPLSTVERVSELDFTAPTGGQSVLQIVATANDIGPANLLAMHTERRAWRLHLSLLQYQSRLRQEAVQAATLLSGLDGNAR